MVRGSSNSMHRVCSRSFVCSATCVLIVEEFVELVSNAASVHTPIIASSRMTVSGAIGFYVLRVTFVLSDERLKALLGSTCL